MKKVLALVMVLSMVGFASAALQIDAAGGKATVMGQLSSDQYLVLTAGDGASLSNFAKGPQAPGLTGFSGSLADFEGLAIYPAGFQGEVWVFASAPGEGYQNGALLSADLAVTKSQATRTWEEIIDCTQVPNGKLTRTWTEVTDFIKGGLALSFFDESGNSGMLSQVSLDSQAVSSLTFVDGPCVPEPLTLSLLGLGALVLRRRS